jgi:hypothetical protein
MTWPDPPSQGWRCRNCSQPILRSPRPGSPLDRRPDVDPYWYHPAFSSIWCDGWGDPENTGRMAEPMLVEVTDATA